MNVTICSRRDAEALLRQGFPAHTAVISLFDPPGRRAVNPLTPLDYAGKAERVFPVAVHDIGPDILDEYGLRYETFLPEAERLAAFILAAKRDGLDILCQCEYGQSRSAGCAAAILEFFEGTGISVFADYRYYPNQMIYHKVYDALIAVSRKEEERDSVRFPTYRKPTSKGTMKTS